MGEALGRRSKHDSTAYLRCISKHAVHAMAVYSSYGVEGGISGSRVVQRPYQAALRVAIIHAAALADGPTSSQGIT